MSKDSFDIYVDDEAVKITDVHGEVVMWTKDEWQEDDTVTPAIANAIITCHKQGVEELRKIINHPGEATGFDYRQRGSIIQTLVPLYGRDVYGRGSENPDKMLVAAGSMGVVKSLAIGWFLGTFQAMDEKFTVNTSFDWGEEGERFVFEDRSGYGNEPSTHA